MHFKGPSKSYEIFLSPMTSLKKYFCCSIRQASDNIPDQRIWNFEDFNIYILLFLSWTNQRLGENLVKSINCIIPLCWFAIKYIPTFMESNAAQKHVFTICLEALDLQLISAIMTHKGLHSPKRFTNLLSGSMSLILN